MRRAPAFPWLWLAAGALAVVGCLAWRRARAQAAPAAAAPPGAYSWLEQSGSAENVFGRPYMDKQGRRDEDVSL